MLQDDAGYDKGLIKRKVQIGENMCSNQVCEEISKMLIAISNYKIALGLIFSWYLAMGIGRLFATFGRNIQGNLTEDIKSSKKSTSLKQKWDSVINIGDEFIKPNKWLGIFEITLFYSSFLFGRLEAIGAWLVFKVAVKWESWANIVKVPEKIKLGKKEIDDFEYLELRNKLATVVSQKFLIGTIGNILAAMIGVGVFCVIKYIF